MSGSSVTLWFAFLGGLAASVTPCVYPLIPVTLAIFGATPDVPRRRAFLLSITYVLGIALTYTVLGIFSALTGSLLGEALRNVWIVGGIAVALVVLALYTLDIIQFEAAYRLQSRASLIGGKGYMGALLMGSVSGVVAAPCAAPLLIAILSVAARSQDAFWGAALLFSYSLGFGVIFVVLGTFSGLMRRLPRSGDWFHLVKVVIAAALLFVALTLLLPFLPLRVPGGPSYLIWGAVFLLFSLLAFIQVA